MKTFHIVSVLLLAAAGSAAYVLLRPVAPRPEPIAAPAAQTPAEPMPVVQGQAPVPTVAPTNPPVAVAVEKPPVQPLEERGDAMLFEIDTLQNSPFDDAVTRPFD